MAGLQIESTWKRGETNDKFLIRLSRGKRDLAHAGELRRALHYFGGIETEGGFEFPSAAQRAEALEILGNKYGTRHFQSEDHQNHNGRPRLVIADSDATLADIHETFFSKEGFIPAARIVREGAFYRDAADFGDSTILQESSA